MVDKGLIGVTGEYFVAAELSNRGYIASITLRNTKGIDILASNVDTSRYVGVQVKTTTVNKKEWTLGKKAENYFEKELFYIFVKLKADNVKPDYHIVPSKTVAEYVKKDYDKWFNTLGKNGQEHNPTTMRKFRDLNDKYLEKWELLELG